MELKIDVLFANEERRRALVVIGPPGLTFYDQGDLLFVADAKPLIASLLEISASGHDGEWAKHLLAALGRTSG